MAQIVVHPGTEWHRKQHSKQHASTPLTTRRYGTRALEQLRRYFEGEIADVMSEDEDAAGAANGSAAPAGNRSSNGPAAAAQGERGRRWMRGWVLGGWWCAGVTAQVGLRPYQLSFAVPTVLLSAASFSSLLSQAAC